MIGEARKDYLKSAGFDVAASVLVQLVALFAILLAANLATLGDAAKLTLALSIAGPLSLLASMALTEKIVARSDGYTGFYEIVASRMLVYVLALAVMIAVFILFWPGKLATDQFATILALVSATRFVDSTSDTAIQIHRRERRFRAVFDIAVLSLIVFLLAFALAYLTLRINAALAAAWAMLLSAFAVALQSYRSLNPDERRLPAGLMGRAITFVGQNALRGGAQLTNSVQGIAPRIALEVYVGPQSQAAFTILSSLARAGTIMLQSAFVPLLPRYASLYAAEPRRALRLSLVSFLLSTLLIGLGFAFCWWLGWRLDLIWLLGRDLHSYISFESGLGVLIGVTLYMLRFAMWQVYGLIGAGDRLLAYAIGGLATTTAGCFLLVPRWGVLGAVFADACGSIVLVVLPFAVLWLQSTKTK